MITNASGAVVADMSFSAFGHRREPGTWEAPVSAAETQTDHNADRYGFTHQEMLDNVNLIHMNGRVYDPTLGRFLSVDPIFEFPTNTQSLNPYSYVLNNPLSMTDPTGYAATDGSICTGPGGSSRGCVGQDLSDMQKQQALSQLSGNGAQNRSGTSITKTQASSPTEINGPHQVSQNESDSGKENKPVALHNGDLSIRTRKRTFIITADALRYIAEHFEQYREFAGLETDGKKGVIGYGHDYKTLDLAKAAYPKGISKPDAYDLFVYDFARAALAVIRNIPTNQSGNAALSDFALHGSKLVGPADLAYNAGYRPTWKAFSDLSQHKFGAAASEFLDIDHYRDPAGKWHVSPLLEERRRWEANLLSPPPP